jgi:DNA-binding transcriptional ArsR family regulator
MCVSKMRSEDLTMPNPPTTRDELVLDLSQVFKLLGSRLHIELVVLLNSAEDGMIGSAIAGCLGVSESVASHHLGLLADAGLVTKTQSGWYRIFRLERTRLEQILTSFGKLMKGSQS